MRNDVWAPFVRVLILLLFLSAPDTPLFAQSLPDPWRTKDIGAPLLAGSAVLESGALRIEGAGTDIWGASDQFRFVFQKVGGDVDVVAKIETLDATHAFAKAGIMIRAANRAGAANVFVHATGSQGVWLSSRPAPGAATAAVRASTRATPVWLRAVRRGARVTAYWSANGSDWTLAGERTVALGTAAFVGIGVTSHDAGTRTTARVEADVVAVGTPMQKSLDIGNPAVAGATEFARGVYAITSAGLDIWDRADQFRFTYQPIDGDADVVARVIWTAATDPWAKAGVMIRESLRPDSPHASALLTSARGYAFQRRPGAGALSVHTAGGAGGAPGWVRIVRTGDVFDAYRSADGKAWTKIGSDVIPMAQTVYVGMAVTSHVAGTPTLAMVDSFKASGAPGTEPAPDAPPPSGDPAPTGLRWVVFTASTSHATLVNSYRLNVFAPGANPLTAKPLVSLGLGKPVPTSTGEIRVDGGGFFATLAAGNYVATVSAVGSGGEAHSGTVQFTR